MLKSLVTITAVFIQFVVFAQGTYDKIVISCKTSVPLVNPNLFQGYEESLAFELDGSTWKIVGEYKTDSSERIFIQRFDSVETQLIDNLIDELNTSNDSLSTGSTSITTKWMRSNITKNKIEELLSDSPFPDSASAREVDSILYLYQNNQKVNEFLGNNYKNQRYELREDTITTQIIIKAYSMGKKVTYTGSSSINENPTYQPFLKRKGYNDYEDVLNFNINKALFMLLPEGFFLRDQITRSVFVEPYILWRTKDLGI